MMKIRLIISLILLGSTITLCKPVNQTQHWFDHQLTDHYDITSNRTWSQRYWVHDQYFNPTNGSVLLYICGEYTCPGIPEDRQFPIQLAKEFNSIILVLEHRFYGNSMPFGDQSLKQHNLRLLNVDQALADLAYFITFVKDHQLHNVSNHLPWISIGGSYPGAMSAWFRYKYPHLTVGALASSAVINAILDFPQFDEQVRRSALLSSQKCAQTIRSLNVFVQEELKNKEKGDYIKRQFRAEKLNNGEFLYFFADIFVEFIQYGTRDLLCDAILDYPTLSQQYDSIVSYAKLSNVTPYYYGSYYLKNDTYDINNDGSRQWTWQYCTEFGFFQTAPKNLTPMRSVYLNLDFFRQLCKESFTEGTWPHPERVNIQYGDINLKAFNLILTNGIEDPWRWAGLQRSQGNVVSYLINCENCAHCVDLYTPDESDAPVLKNTRAKITAHFRTWIKEHYQNLSQDNCNQTNEIPDLFVEKMINKL